MQGSKRLICEDAASPPSTSCGWRPGRDAGHRQVRPGTRRRTWPGYAADDPEVTTADKALAKLVKELEDNRSGRTAGVGITVDQLLTEVAEADHQRGSLPHHLAGLLVPH